MVRFTGCSWFGFCFALFVVVSSDQLPSCQQARKQISLPSVSACHRFFKLLEDPQYCSLDQSQNCCVVLAAAVTNHCHCWKLLPKATYDLVNVLHQHCGRRLLTDSSQQLDVKLFIGVLTSANHAAQRQAGDMHYSKCHDIHKALSAFVLSCCSARYLGQRSTSPSSRVFLRHSHQRDAI